MLNVDKALISIDLHMLNDIVTIEKEKADIYKYQQDNMTMSDNDIF